MRGIYQIRNKENGKTYIGSSEDIFSRWNGHKSDLKYNIHRNPHLQRAWNKYGASSFLFRIVECVDEEVSLIEREQHWMDALDVVDSGYNIAPIAGSRAGCKNRMNLTPEQKIKKSVRHGEAMRENWAKKKGKENNNSEWYYDGGMGDLWLRANDPDYGDRKKVNYLTERQYRYRAKEKEVPSDPLLMDKVY